MRGIYKAFLFLLIFQFIAVTLAVLNVFPIGLYSDVNFEGLDENSGWMEYVAYFFGASYGEFWGSNGALALFGISGLLIGAGALGAILHGNITPIMVSILAVMSIHMLATSKEFFSTMFIKGGIAVVYLGVCLFIALGALILFSIVEAPLGGGDSG